MRVLQTENCILRPVTLEDTKDLFECYSQDRVVKYLPFKKHKTLLETRNFIRNFFLNNYTKSRISHFGVVYKKDNKTIGHIGFNEVSKNFKEGEIGICINPNYWGQNLASELTREILRYGFYELKLNKIIANTFEENNYSRKSLEELGFRYLGTHKKKFKSSPKPIICHRYELNINSYRDHNVRQ